MFDVVVVHVNFPQVSILLEHISVDGLQEIIVEKYRLQISIFTEQSLIDVSDFVGAEW